jgi:hypothetical protein
MSGRGRLALLLAGIAWLAGCAEREERVNRVLATTPNGAVRIFMLSGSVRVVGWDRDSVEVTGTVGPGLHWGVGGAPGAVKIGTYDMGDENSQALSRLTVRVPMASQLWIKTTAAAVSVENFNGSLDVYTIDGPVQARGAGRQLRIETIRGSVDVAGGPQWLRVRTGAGDIDLRGGAQNVALVTVSGAIRSDMRFARGRFETFSGSVSLTGSLAPGSHAEVDTHSGRAEMRLTGTPDAEFNLFTNSGTVHTSLAGAPTVRRTTGGTETRFTVNGGAAHATIRTFSGEIHLKQ